MWTALIGFDSEKKSAFLNIKQYSSATRLLVWFEYGLFSIKPILQ